MFRIVLIRSVLAAAAAWLLLASMVGILFSASAAWLAAAALVLWALGSLTGRQLAVTAVATLATVGFLEGRLSEIHLGLPLLGLGIVVGLAGAGAASLILWAASRELRPPMQKHSRQTHQD